MKPLLLSALFLSACVNATLATSAHDHQEFALATAPSINASVEVGFEAALSGNVADALKKAETPTNKFVDSVTLDGLVSAAVLSTNTTLAGIERCQIGLKAGTGTVTLVDHTLSAQEKSRGSVSLPLQNAALADVRPLLEQSRPALTLTLQVLPSELTASKVMTDLTLEVSADISASL